MLNNLITYVKNLLKSNKYTTLDLNILPSMNLFYDKIFNIDIRPINSELVTEYNNTNFSNPFEISEVIYKILCYCVNVPEGYTVSDILCCDIMYVFFEIVKLTRNEKLYFKKKLNDDDYFEFLEFNSENYDYYQIPEDIARLYDYNNKCFNIDGFEFRLPRYKFDGILLEYTLDNDISTLNYIIVAYFSHKITDKIGLNTLLSYNDVLFEDADAETIEKMLYVISHLSKISIMKLTNNIIDINIIESLDMRSILK